MTAVDLDVVRAAAREARARAEAATSAPWDIYRTLAGYADAMADEIERLRATVQAVRDWAFTVHGGVKSPADVWPGLRALLDAAPSRVTVTPPAEQTGEDE